MSGAEADERDTTRRILAGARRDLAHADGALHEALEEVAAHREELERLAAVKEEYLRIAAHDLRSPLTAIAAAAETLKSGACGRLSEPAARMAQVILDAAWDLTRFAESILDLGKLEAGGTELAPEETDVAALLRRVAKGHEFQAQQAGVGLEVQAAALVVRLDPVKIRQVLANLIQNALKFTPRGGRIVVRAVIAEDALRLEVQDSGRGIPAHLLDSIFEKYVQIPDPFTEGRRGVGLGLAICRRIVELHGGRIRVQSVEGQGSTFRVSLPLRGS